MKDTFDPEDITKEDMNKVADHIEGFLLVLKEIIYIPEELLDEHGKKIEKGISRTEKLIKKLRKGDRSIFKDQEDWNVIS